MTEKIAELGHFDCAIIGGGLSGLLHADALTDVLDPNLRVAIIDPSPDGLKGKTFCSWRKSTDAPHRYSGLVSNRWRNFRFTSSQGLVTTDSFGDYCYERISGERLHQHIHDKISDDPRFLQLRTAIRGVSEPHLDPAGKSCALLELQTGHCLTASRVLSSPARAPAPILQYFVGVEIQTAEECFEEGTVDLMDFRLPQEGDARFVYILPFSSRSALIEFTVFSGTRMPDAECESILMGYIASVLKIRSFTLSNKEFGTIPMSVEMEPVFPPAFPRSVVEVIGGAAGRVKASTGYSFQRNLEERSSSSAHSFSRSRFRVYDSLLLGVIRSDGGAVSEVFHRLFGKNPPAAVFSFLDEKSRFGDEIRIFASLPWRPFLLQLVAQYPFMIAVAATSILQATLGPAAGWLVPGLGLATSGIGHGSLDHLMDLERKPGAPFYARYLGRMVVFLVAWFFFPIIALVFFVLQSADHFGESNWVRSLRYSRNDHVVRALAWVWGLFAAMFGVLFHWQESLPLIQAIVGSESQLGSISIGSARALAAVLFLSAAASALVLDRYEQRVTRQSTQGFPATLVLAASLMALPLLEGFLCFFAFWHGWDTMRMQRMQKGWTSSEYWRKALPFTAVSTVATLLVWLAFADSSEAHLKWKILFIALGALTAAHAPVMKRLLLSSRPDGA
jgi:lycopene beta-cyclase